MANDSYKRTLDALKQLHTQSGKTSESKPSTAKNDAARSAVEAIISSRGLLQPKKKEESQDKSEQDVASISIKATKDQAKTAKVAAKESIRLRKNIDVVVKRFKVLEGIIKDISKTLSSAKDPGSKITRIGNLITSGGDAYKEIEAELEEKPSISGLVQQTSAAVGKSALGIGALILAIPLLFSPEVRQFISDFFNSFLEGLGLSNDAIRLIKPAIGAVIGVLGAVFTMKALAPVIIAFEKMKQLAEVLGLAGEMVNEKKVQADIQQDGIDAEKKQTKKAGDKAKAELKGTKRDLKKGKKLSFWKKLPFLLNKITPRLIGLFSGVLKALPVIGTVLGIGMVLWDVFNLGKDVYDFFFGKEEKDEEADTEQEATAALSSTSEPSGNGADSAPVAAPEAKSTTASTLANGAPQPSAGAVEELKPAAAATPSPESSAAVQTQAASSSSEPPSVSAQPGVMPEPTSESNKGSEIQMMSTSVEIAEIEKQRTPSNNIMLVNNVTNMITQNEEPIRSGSIYSVSVGV